eukprot:5989546-Ditylum_brightwellii.AAC.1
MVPGWETYEIVLHKGKVSRPALSKELPCMVTKALVIQVIQKEGLNYGAFCNNLMEKLTHINNPELAMHFKGAFLCLKL